MSLRKRVWFYLSNCGSSSCYKQALRVCLCFNVKKTAKLLKTSCHHSPLCTALDQKNFSEERTVYVSQLSWTYIFHQPCSINREIEKGSSCACQMFHWSSHASFCTYAKTLALVLPELSSKFFGEALAFIFIYLFFCPVGRGDGYSSLKGWWKNAVRAPTFMKLVSCSLCCFFCRVK